MTPRGSSPSLGQASELGLQGFAASQFWTKLGYILHVLQKYSPFIDHLLESFSNPAPAPSMHIKEDYQSPYHHLSHCSFAMDPPPPSSKPQHSSCYANMQAAHMATPTPSLADMLARRSISDSVLSRARSRVNLGSPLRSSATAVNLMVLNRSGGSQVKQAIEVIRERCLEQESNPHVRVPLPEDECCILAQCAVDAYYRVVITGRGGIPVLVRAMRAFLWDRDLQECCCLALGNLCANNGSTLLAVDSAGGVAQIIAAMRNHPQSVAVQSAACDALRNMSGLLLQLAMNPGSADLAQQLVDALSHTKGMCLLPSHRNIAEGLLRAVSSTSGLAPR